MDHFLQTTFKHIIKSDCDQPAPAWVGGQNEKPLLLRKRKCTRPNLLLQSSTQCLRKHVEHVFINTI